MLLLIGDLLVVVDVDEVLHQPGFFVGHVVATLGFLELVLIGFNVEIVESGTLGVDGWVGRLDEGGWVGSGGIV